MAGGRDRSARPHSAALAGRARCCCLALPAAPCLDAPAPAPARAGPAGRLPAAAGRPSATAAGESTSSPTRSSGSAARNDLLVAIGNVEITQGATPAARRPRRAEPGYRRRRRPGQGRLLRRPGPARRGPDRLQHPHRHRASSTTARSSTAPYYTCPASAWSASARASTASAAGRSPRARATTRRGPSGSAPPPPTSTTPSTAATRRSGCKDIPSCRSFPFFGAAIRRERQTGFLFPSFGFSSERGFFAQVPFFWAINDSQDLTVALDTYTERGVGGRRRDYRYILSERAPRQRRAGF